MQPIEFEGTGKPITFAKDQPQYQPLPARVSEDGTVTTMWEPSPVERSRLAAGGFLQLDQMAFHKPLQPVNLSVIEPVTSEIPTGMLTKEQMALVLGQVAAQIFSMPGTLRHWHTSRTESGAIKGVYIELE